MRSSRLVRGVLCGAALFGFAYTSTSPATSAIYSPQQALPSATVQQFLANPSSLLTQYPNGGPQMIQAVRDLIASDPQTVGPILSLLKNANDAQADAIGTAGGQVALMAINKDQPFAVDLQTQFAQAGNVIALTAFSKVVGGDIKLSAATTTTGIGGGGESQTSGNNASGGFSVGGGFNLSTSHADTAGEFPTITIGGGGPGSNPVSP